jgi:hypothetical protein
MSKKHSRALYQEDDSISGIVFLGGLLILFLVAWILSTFDLRR